MKRSIVLFLIVAASLQTPAADATWNRNADGSWNIATNWSPAVIPNGVGESAWLTNDINGNRTITLDAAITIGHMTIGDSNDSNNFIVNNGTGGSLTFATTNTQATLDKRGTKIELIGATITLQNNLRVSNSGPVTISGAIGESGGPYGLIKEGPGLLTVSNNNTWNGNTIVGGGVLHATITNGLARGNLQITNGIVEIDIQDLIRVGGTASNQMQITGGQSGFGANGAGNRTARFGATAGAPVTWGSTFFNPDVFVLNASNAGRQINFDNNIDLNGQLRRIDVNANIGQISRNITNGPGLIKGGSGTLSLNASNRWVGPLIVTGGTVRLDNIAALPPGNLELYNGILELGRHTPDLYRSFGTGEGQMQLSGNSGWGAHNAERIFMIGSNVATLVWGSGGLANLGALALNGPSAGGIVSIANPIDLNGSIRTVTVNAAVAKLLGGVTNSSVSPASMVKNGGGTLLIPGGFDSLITLGGGNLQLGDYWALTGVLPGPNGNADNLVTTGGTLVLANPGDVETTTTLSGVISGSGSFTKNDRQTVRLTGANTYSGNTTVDRGTLLLDFEAAGAPASNIISASSALILGNVGYDSGTVHVRAASLATNRQTFRTTTVNQGMARILADGGLDGAAEISLSNITRNAGGAVDLATAGDGKLFTSTTNVFGIIGGYASYNGSDWAAWTPGSGLVVAYTGYTDVAGAPILDGSNTNIRASGALTLGSPTTTVQTLTMTNDGSAVSIDLGGNNLRLAVLGGILVPPGGGTLTIGSSPNDGLLNAGLANNTAGVLILMNNSTNEVVVNAAVNNNGSGTAALVKTGRGPVRFAGNVRAYGSTYFNEGLTRLSGVNVITNINLNDGDLWLDSASSNNIGGNVTINGGTMTIDGPVLSSGQIDVGTVAGGRGVLRISTNVTATRIRGGANDNVRTGSAIFQTGGQLFSAAEANGTTISDGLGNYGYYQISGGSLTGNFAGTFRGIATIDVNGGRITPSNNFLIANATGWGTMNVRDGGAVYAPFTAGGTLRFCGTDFGNALAVLNVLGGMVDTATTTNSKAVDLMSSSGNSAYLNLLGGVVTANQVRATTVVGTSVLTFNGGTLAAAHGTALGSTFMQGLSTSLVQAGGAIIDVNSNSVTIGQSLQAPSGYGLAAIPVNTNCGAGYVGVPAIAISGGSGTGAQAIAEVDFSDGSITNIRVVNPGWNYQGSDTLTVRIAGGMPTVLPVDFAISGAALATNISGGLLKLGPGALTLTNANTYGGVTTVKTGVLAISHGSALGSVAGHTVVSNLARLNVSGNITVAEPLTLLGEGEVVGAYNGALRSSAGTNTVSGAITITNVSTRIRVNANSLLNISGGISAAGNNYALTLVADSNAQLRLASTPISLPGPTAVVTLHGGGGTIYWAVDGNAFGQLNLQYNETLTLETNNVLPTNAIFAIGVDAGAGTNATFNLNGFHQTVGELRGGKAVDLKRITNLGTNESVFTVGSSNMPGAFNGAMSDGSAPLALRKIGTGTLVLQGDNTFTGWTVVQGGTLALQTNAGLASTSMIVAAGATLSVTGRTDGTLALVPGQVLGGSGSIVGDVVSLGSIAPGESVGTLTVTGALTQTTLGALMIEVDGSTQADLLAMTGTAALDGDLTVTTNTYAPASGNTYTVLVASAISGTYATTNLPPLGTGLGWTVQYLPAAVVLSVTGAPALNGYDLWATAITNGLTNFNDSATGDGYPNLLKYATGSSPTTPDNLAAMSGTRAGGLLSLLFNRNTAATDVTFVVEGAYSIANDAVWNGIATNAGGSWGAATNVSEVGGSPVAVTVQDNEASATNRFLRLRVTRP